MIRLTVDGTDVTVQDGATILDAVRAAGIVLPTLCHAEGLAPYGARRLCMVSLNGPRDTLVAACVYPAADGLKVETEIDRAKSARRMAMEFLFARCPESETLKTMAEGMGVIESRFPAAQPPQKDELYMLCGLCVRVCHEAVGAGAIGFAGRGADRHVTAPFALQAEACIGCGACAAICPTGAIRMEDDGSTRILHNWNTRLALLPCPECGQYFAPAKMAILEETFPEIKDSWTLCPQCRNRKTAGAFINLSR
jgi:bidirectional [NiFe] hydrogenase diaphorase subunit